MLNKQQQKIHDAALLNLKRGYQQVYEYSGRSGTGKTYTLFQICADSGIPMSKILPMAYTGAAAAVLRRKGFPNATTLHSGLYVAQDFPNPAFKRKQKEIEMNHQFGVPDVPPTITKFVPKKKLPGIELMVIDEGFMCPEYMKRIIEGFGIPIIVTGDMRQLPPVESRPAYLDNTTHHIPELTELMRQDALSPIVYIANRILDDKPIHTGNYGNKVLVIEDDEITPNMLRHSELILSGSNATRDYWNTKIRKDIWNYTSALPGFGERVICRKNNHSQEVDGIALANGLIGYCVSATDVAEYNGKLFRMDFLPDITSVPFKNLICDYEYFKLPSRMRKTYYNKFAMGERFEFAYCITTHLSQGSEARQGIYFDENLNWPKDTQRRLAYTGVTRFKDFLIFVKPRRRIF